MRDRVILMVGLYDTLDIFTYELKKEFEKIGLEVMIFNSQDMEGSMIKLSEFIKEPVKAVVTFNNLGFNMELIKGQNIWEQLQIPCINILMDHPFIHKKALDNAPANAVVICPDRNHMKFVQRFYPQIPIVGFLPHGGKAKDISIKPICESDEQARVLLRLIENTARNAPKNIVIVPITSIKNPQFES